MIRLAGLVPSCLYMRTLQVSMLLLRWCSSRVVILVKVRLREMEGCDGVVKEVSVSWFDYFSWYE